MEPVETVEVETKNVSCDGDSALGHPRIFLKLDNDGEIDCPYCGRHFVLRDGAESQLEGHQ